ncbi:MAG TPA: DUF1778 domain-containing protein [Gemmatimonadaceae bacterium]|nr:DUF1778 domain-containing protein [Gemmatimonadaceae bacterium]
MRSVRLEPALDDRVRRAAEAEGTTVSEFLRTAAAERADRTLSHRNTDRLADVIGSVRGGGAGQARDTGAAFGKLLDERRKPR